MQSSLPLQAWLMFSERAGAVGSPVAGSVASQTEESKLTRRRRRADAAANSSRTLAASPARSISSARRQSIGPGCQTAPGTQPRK
jgi:hypothetical protein